MIKTQFFLCFLIFVFIPFPSEGAGNCQSAFSAKTEKNEEGLNSLEKEGFSILETQRQNRDLLFEVIKEVDAELFNENSKAKKYTEEDIVYASHTLSKQGSVKISTRALSQKSEREIKKILKASPFEKYNKAQLLQLMKNTNISFTKDYFVHIKMVDLNYFYEKIEKEELKSRKKYSSIFYIPGKNPKETMNHILETKKELENQEFSSISDKAVVSRDDLFTGLKTEDKKQVLKTLVYLLQDSYSRHLFYPVQKFLSNKSKIDVESLNSFLHDSLAYRNYTEFISDVNSRFVKQKGFYKEILANAYMKAINENQKQENSVRRHPNPEDIVKQLKNFPDMDSMLVEKLLGLKPAFFNESLFNGWNDIKEFSKALKPGMFNNFVDNKIYHEQAQNFINRIKKDNTGFIVSSATAGVPLNDSFFNLILKEAEKRDIPLVIMAVNRETEHLPYVKLVEREDGPVYQSVLRPNDPDKEMEDKDQLIPLHEVPNVFVISHTINLSPFLTLDSTPLMPKNFNPFASLNRLMYKTSGKTNVFAHPQPSLKVEPSGDNHINPTTLIATGSISSKIYPYRTAPQGRISELAKAVHKNKVWMFEPVDKDAGLDGKSVPGMYHHTPIYERSYEDPVTREIYKGIISESTFHGKYGEEIPVDVEYIVLGDLHVGSTNQKFFKVIGELLEKHPKANIVLHDSFDGSSINHHESKRVLSNSQKTQKGQLNLTAEYKRNVEVINSFLELTEGKIYFVVSNHPAWLTNYLNEKESYSDPINSKLLTEIRHAVETGNLDPFEYLYQERETYHKSHPDLNTRMQLAMENIYVSDPNRIVVLTPGEPFNAGTSDSPIRLDVHSHNITGRPGQGITPSSAPNLETAVVGHSHKPSITLGTTDVGTSTNERLDYTKGSALSSWVNGFALIYKDSSQADLFIVPPLLQKHQSTGNQLPPEEHFPEQYPNFELQDNEEAPDASMTSSQDNFRKSKKKK